jgi:type VI secretion system secreted protein Hcp
MFLHIQGIVGESLDNYRKGWIEIQNWNWETSNPIRWDVNQGGQSTKAKIEKIVVQKACDQASAALYRYCVTGKHFKHAQLICRKNDGEKKLDYLTIDMDDVMIQKVNWTGQGDLQTLSETIEIQFAEFEIKYKTQHDSGESSAKGDQTFRYNLQTQFQK